MTRDAQFIPAQVVNKDEDYVGPRVWLLIRVRQTDAGDDQHD
jgi:hypothetical protein